MNRIAAILLIALAAVLGFAAAWWLKPEGAAAPEAPAEREILYWVAPMDPNYRRDGPGKSPMGMDLVPVYADEAAAGGSEPSIRIAPAVVNNIGVRTAEVERGRLVRRIDTVGFITTDDARIAHIHVRAEGWIEELLTVTEGAEVRAGDVLFRIDSPALVSAQEEFIQALRTGPAGLATAARARLEALGMRNSQIDQLAESRRVQQLLEVRAPQDGYVMELNVRQGMYVQPGVTILSLADLATVWVDVDVFERRIGWVEVGQIAEMRLPFAPDRVWQGTVDYVYPTIRAASRTARVRLKFDNPDLALKPEMYASVSIEAAPRDQVLNVPTPAVIRAPDGDRVILALGEGRFRPAEVRIGIESDGRTEILAGLAEGERIVVSSQFLIDSEASLDASLLRMIDPPEHDHSMHHMDHAGTDHSMHGMDHSGHDMSGMDHSMHHMNHADQETSGMDHSAHEMDHSGHDMSGMDHSSHDMDHSGHDMDHAGHQRPTPDGDAEHDHDPR